MGTFAEEVEVMIGEAKRVGDGHGAARAGGTWFPSSHTSCPTAAVQPRRADARFSRGAGTVLAGLAAVQGVPTGRHSAVDR